MSHFDPKPDPEPTGSSRDVRSMMRQWPVILLITLLAGLGANLTASSVPDEYTATTVLEVAAPDVLAQLNGASASSPPEVASREASTIAALITQPTILRRTSNALDGQLSTEQLSAALGVVVGNDVNLVNVSATTQDPELAATVANTAAKTFIADRRRRQREENESAQDELRRQLDSLDENSGTAGLIRERLRSVEASAAAGSDVNVVEAAQAPTTPSAPRPLRLTLVGLLAGGLLGIAIAFIRTRTDDRIREQREFQEIWDVPLVGAIPKVRSRGDGTQSMPPTSMLEAFGSVRANLRYLQQDQPGVLVLTAGGRGEGTSTSVWQLAVASALAESSVLVIEGDLRKPGLAQQLGLSPEAGVGEILVGSHGFNDAVHSVPVGDPAAGLTGSVDVLFAGAATASPTALLQRSRLRDLIDGVRHRYDLVLIDTPPASFADPLILAGLADEVLVVARSGVTTRPSFVRLREQLQRSGTPIAGLLVNGLARGDQDGYVPVSTAPAPAPAAVRRAPSRSSSGVVT